MDISSWHALFNNVGDLNITFWILMGYRDTGHFGHMGPLNLPREGPNMETWRGGGRQVLQGAATKYCLKVSAPPSMYLMSSVLQVLGLVYHTHTHPPPRSGSEMFETSLKPQICLRFRFKAKKISRWGVPLVESNAQHLWWSLPLQMMRNYPDNIKWCGGKKPPSLPFHNIVNYVEYTGPVLQGVFLTGTPPVQVQVQKS